MRLGARAGRGRMYAEQGQVTSLMVEGAHVEATVLGARPDPYVVKVDFAPVAVRDGSQQLDACECFGLMTVARMLSGEMPLVVDEFFSREGFPLYPKLGTDTFWCSCPDWSKPCKHIAAVLYLLGDAMVRDPALLLRLRGVEIPSASVSQPVGLPLWKGAEKLEDFMARISRRVYRR